MMDADVVNHLTKILVHASEPLQSKSVKVFTALVAFGKQLCLHNMQTLTFEQRILEQG